MVATRFTELVGCRAPIQQAVMGSATTCHLVAAVTGAGGLGMVPDVAQTAERLLDAAARARQ